MPVKHEACPCGKSSDAYVQYPTGGYCYSCSKKFWKDKAATVATLEETTVQQFPYRGHALAALQKYAVRLYVSVATDEIVKIVYPYNGAEKYRWPDKTFSWKDHKGPCLWGKERFESGQSRYVTITEGEEDAMASYEMNGFQYPVVSVQSSGSAAKDCAADKEWLDGFERIYLDFDNDEAGRAAVRKVSVLFPYSKVFVVKKTTYKDANDYLINNAIDEYRKAWFAARPDNPEDVISSFADIAKVFAKPKKHAIATFPFQQLQEMTYGIRTGETYLLKAMEGIGKTELLGAIEYHVAKTTDLPIGVIHLEEDVQRSAYRFVGYEVKAPVHLEGFTNYGPTESLEVFRQVAKADGRINFYVQGKNDKDVEAFLASIRFMVAQAGCKVVFFDHISRVAVSFGLDTAGLDAFATSLSKLAAELDFALIMISHVNDDGLTRGSRNISKEAWTVISLDRDKLNPDPMVRNTTNLIIEKNRHASFTGPAGCVYFDINTFCVSDEIPLVVPQV